MDVHYYLSVFPIEALIASQLEPNQFGTYMATGSKKGSAEQIIFCEISGEFEGEFDWDYAKEKCVPHSYGDPKHSVYLGVYRILERLPLNIIDSMYLATRDGRVLEIEKQTYEMSIADKRGYYIYQELCPLTPVIVSRLDPEMFGQYMTDDNNKVYIPKLIYADLKTLDFDHPEQTGNIGSIYDRKVPHLMECVATVTSDDEKINKTLTRTHIESFSFQTVHRAFYVSDGATTLMYQMPDSEALKKIDYDWGRSALIL